MALTRMMCPDIAMKVEAAVTSVLQGQVPYLLNADVLAVGTAARLLVYRSDLPPAA
jgi:heat shock protein HslJ